MSTVLANIISAGKGSYALQLQIPAGLRQNYTHVNITGCLKTGLVLQFSYGGGYKLRGPFGRSPVHYTASTMYETTMGFKPTTTTKSVSINVVHKDEGIAHLEPFTGTLPPRAPRTRQLHRPTPQSTPAQHTELRDAIQRVNTLARALNAELRIENNRLRATLLIKREL